MHPRVAELIALLGLAPHPEGGHFHEVYRSAIEVRRAGRASPRRALTHIHYLLAEGEFSRWHRVASDEVWTLHEGGPLELLTIAPGARTVGRAILGPVGAEGGPSHVVPGGAWQAARPLGPYALAACTVAPGFDFLDFTMLADYPEELTRLRAAGTDLQGLL